MNLFHTEDHLQQFGTDILETTWREFTQLAQEQIALTWIVYDPPVIVNTGERFLTKNSGIFSLRI
jgi:hypothetical protein